MIEYLRNSSHPKKDGAKRHPYQADLKRQVRVLALLVIIVIAGIYCYAILLTLVVVPVLCSLVDNMKKGIDR